MSKLIAITGPAAVGKSTVAKRLQAAFAGNDDLWLVMELDAFGRGLPRDWIALGAHAGRNAKRGYAYALDRWRIDLSGVAELPLRVEPV